jgi:hypothetical protein
MASVWAGDDIELIRQIRIYQLRITHVSGDCLLRLLSLLIARVSTCTCQSDNNFLQTLDLLLIASRNFRD